MQEKVNISLVQPGFDVGPSHLDIYYLPYTIGLLWAYAKQNKQIDDNYQVETIKEHHIKITLKKSKTVK